MGRLEVNSAGHCRIVGNTTVQTGRHLAIRGRFPHGLVEHPSFEQLCHCRHISPFKENADCVFQQQAHVESSLMPDRTPAFFVASKGKSVIVVSMPIFLAHYARPHRMPLNATSHFWACFTLLEGPLLELMRFTDTPALRAAVSNSLCCALLVQGIIIPLTER